MLQVRKALCLGCGLCTESCPREAISVQSGQAWIDQAKCNRCGVCLNACPQEAIVESAPVPEAELVNMVGSLKQRANDLAMHIEKLKQQRSVDKAKEKSC